MQLSYRGIPYQVESSTLCDNQSIVQVQYRGCTAGMSTVTAPRIQQPTCPLRYRGVSYIR